MANKIGFILWFIRCFLENGLIRFLYRNYGNHGKILTAANHALCRSDTQQRILMLIFSRMEYGTKGVEFPAV